MISTLVTLEKPLKTILIVDDDRRIRDLMIQFLLEEGFDAVAASCAAEARANLASKSIDLIVLDIMMPGEDGLQLTESLRQSSKVPILLLTARDEVEDRIRGLEVGADDYLTKPFEPRELVARIRAIMRRSQERNGEGGIINLGDFSFNPAEGVLMKGHGNIFLTSTELALLKTFAQNPRQPFAREDLAQRIGHRVSERSVDVQITRLRRKIDDDPRQPKYIQTVRHIGYALCPDKVTEKD